VGFLFVFGNQKKMKVIITIDPHPICHFKKYYVYSLIMYKDLGYVIRDHVYSLIIYEDLVYVIRAPGIHIECYHGSKKEKERSLAKVRRKGGVLLTSYGMIVTSWEAMSRQDSRPFKWVK
jgi:hypothetical protein